MMWAGGRGQNKYRNHRVEVDGLKFDSKREAKRWAQLKLLVAAGEITALETQVRFPIVVNGEKICSYVADFVYKDEVGEMIVEDVKSPATRKNPTYRLKFKLFRAIYGVEIMET